MMSADELWRLHEDIRTILSTKLDAEKLELEHRLARLDGRSLNKKKRVDLTRRCFQSTAIQSSPLKPGLDEGGNRTGLGHS